MMMMNNIFDEQNLRFDFSGCGKAIRFDVSKPQLGEKPNPRGLSCVDFVVDSPNCLYFIEVKDFQNPNAPHKQKQKDIIMLKEVANKQSPDLVRTVSKKLRDSLLRWYAEGQVFNKNVCFLFVMRLDKLSDGIRKDIEKYISGHIPTGLNNDKSRFPKFTNLAFNVIAPKDLNDYGIDCTTITT